MQSLTQTREEVEGHMFALSLTDFFFFLNLHCIHNGAISYNILMTSLHLDTESVDTLKEITFHFRAFFTVQ